LLEILAQATPPAGSQPPGALQFLANYGPIILIVIVMYFLVFNSKRKQDKERKDMIAALKKGDRVQTIGGVLGSVVQVDGDEIVVKVDETTNSKIRFVRSAIQRVISDELKTETK